MVLIGVSRVCGTSARMQSGWSASMLWCFRPQPRNESERPAPDNFIAAVPTIRSHQIMAKAGIYPLALYNIGAKSKPQSRARIIRLQPIVCGTHFQGGKSAPHDFDVKMIWLIVHTRT